MLCNLESNIQIIKIILQNEVLLESIEIIINLSYKIS
jgi:hypothetical protein